MAALRLGHSPEDFGFARGHPAGDDLVDAAGHDLAAPGLKQTLAELGIDAGVRGHRPRG
jgi:hypothetical protein